jgi:mycothiol synthase
MPIPNQLVIRSFKPDQDIPGLLALYAQVRSVDLVGDEVTEQALLEQLNSPGHDPNNDRWVVEAQGLPPTLVGSALIQSLQMVDYSEANILVHPSWRRQGIGSELLARIVSRVQQLDADGIQIYADSRLPGSSAFLQKHSFNAVGAYTEMQLTEGHRLPPVIWPYGYSMRPYSEVKDLAILTQAMNLCYIPLWGHRDVSEEEMASWLPYFNPESIFLVFSEKGRVVGISRVENSPERSHKNGVPTGFIDAPGVVPQHRRLDLYRALVLTGINWLYQQGQSIVEMESWGDKLEVLKMYRELGFEDIRQLVCYRYDLAGNTPRI